MHQDAVHGLGVVVRSSAGYSCRREQLKVGKMTGVVVQRVRVDGTAGSSDAACWERHCDHLVEEVGV